MSSIKRKIQKLLNEGMIVKKHEAKYSDFGYLGTCGSETRKWLNDVMVMTKNIPDNHPLQTEIKRVYSHKGMASTFDKMYNLLESLRDDDTLEGEIMKGFKIISSESEEVLNKIIENENNSDYWRERFENLNKKEDIIIRGCFKELQDNNLIKVSYADDYPYIIQVLKDGYFYQEHKLSSLKLNYEKHTSTTQKEYDIFISHASKDKLSYVNDLYLSISKLKIKIFYDTEEIEWGDNWKQTILNGTEKSEFAVIVISKNFLDREWTERELSIFLNRQNESGQKIILPLLYDITIDDLKNKYPELETIQALDSKKYTKEEDSILLARQLIKRYKGLQ